MMAQITFKRLLRECVPTSAGSGWMGMLLRNASKTSKCQKSVISSMYPFISRQKKENNLLLSRRQRHVAIDDVDEKITVDKNLHRLLEKWELEKAVEIVIQCSVSNSSKSLPNGTTILELLRSLSAIGDVENTLRVQTIALQHKLLTKKVVYPRTAEAFYNSGKIVESLKTIEDICMENKSFKDIEILFSQVTYRIVKDFPEKIDLVIKFADTTHHSLNDPKAYAVLWKCHILAEQFESADKLQENHPLLKPYIAVMVNEICQKRDKIEYDEIKILKKLVVEPGLRPKLTAYIYELLLDRLVTVFNWDETLNVLHKAMNSEAKLHQSKVMSYLDILSGYYNSGSERTRILELQQWANCLN